MLINVNRLIARSIYSNLIYRYIFVKSPYTLV